jgi:NAD(P)-dependent dehydrogenase (short-subunit alcohol dehydrogenase family)
LELEGRAAVVTGGASGIGRALALRFAQEGARSVVVADLDEGRASAVAEEIGGSALGVACDVSDHVQVAELIDTAREYAGGIDVFCANAGIGTGLGIDAPDEAWDAIMGVNVQAHVFAARQLVPYWVEHGGGYFVSTASAAGLLSQIGDAPYTVTKAAAVAFAEWLAITYGDQGVRVSCLCPMGVRTPLVEGGLELEGDQALPAKIVAAAGELLEPEQVAEDVVEAMREERFLILPHPEVAEFMRRKADDRDRWLAGMRRIQAYVAGGGAPAA